MKNKLKSLLLITVLAIFALCSCSKNDPIKEIPVTKLTTPILTIDHTTVSLIESEGEKPAINFTWTPSSENVKVKVNYTLYLNIDGKDMFKGAIKDMAANQTVTYSHLQLNNLLSNELGISKGKTVKINLCISAVDKDAILESATSVISSFTVTTAAPAELYLVGGAFDTSWKIENAAKLSPVSPGVYEATNIILKFGALVDGKGIKFLLSKTEWMPFYGQDKDVTEFGKVKLFADGDSQFYPLANGYANAIYTVRLDINGMKLTLTKTGDVAPDTDFTKSIFMLGDATAFGWSFNKDNVMTDKGNGVYEYASVHLSGEKSKGFKFFVGFENWSNYYGRLDPINMDPYWTIKLRDGNEADAQYYLFEAGMKAGTYKVQLDNKLMTITLTLLIAD